ncbi:MAG: MerR family transcriptional regulator [Actinomycetota bacterium]
MADEQGFRGPQACSIVGITYRQLDYWARTGLVRPGVKDAQGSGTQRVYSFKDLVHLRVIKNLLDAGVALPKIRKAISYIADELRTPLEKVTLMSDGKSIYAATSDREIVDLLRKGQGVFGIALGRVYDDLRGAVATITERPAATPVAAHAGNL